ncbi:MAG: hypothetical protein V3S69_00255 [Dehalococcoidales bacterium]
MSFQSSSAAALVNYLLPTLKTLLGYENSVEAFEDRVNHRALWFELIKAINFNDPTTLGRKIFEDKDVYCGIRNITEYAAIRENIPDTLSIWVDASKRCEPEDDKSCTVTPDDMDIILDNNGTIDELKAQINDLVAALTEAQRLADILHEGDK